MDTNWWELQMQACYKRQAFLREAHQQRQLSGGDGKGRARMPVFQRISDWAGLDQAEPGANGAPRELPDGRDRDIWGAPSSWSTEMK